MVSLIFEGYLKFNKDPDIFSFSKRIFFNFKLSVILTLYKFLTDVPTTNVLGSSKKLI